MCLQQTRRTLSNTASVRVKQSALEFKFWGSNSVQLGQKCLVLSLWVRVWRLMLKAKLSEVLLLVSANIWSMLLYQSVRLLLGSMSPGSPSHTYSEGEDMGWKCISSKCLSLCWLALQYPVTISPAWMSLFFNLFRITQAVWVVLSVVNEGHFDTENLCWGHLMMNCTNEFLIYSNLNHSNFSTMHWSTLCEDLPAQHRVGVSVSVTSTDIL